MKTDRRLAEALAERDEALRALAAEREISNALRLAKNEPALPTLPASVGPGPVPLRYQLADKANDALKQWLGPLHRFASRTLGNREG